MLAFLAPLWSFLCSPLGRTVAEIVSAVAVFLTAWALFAGHYEAKGAARVQAIIDAPDAGWRARLTQCQASAATLDASLTRQNAAVDALKAAGDADTVRAEKAASDARAVAESYRRQSAAIGAKPPQGVDQCSRVMDVDSKLMESLK